MIRTSEAIALSLGIAIAVLPASALLAQTRIDEATGTWATTEGEGFYFRATLTQSEDEADLKIWNGAGTIPDGTGDPDLAVDGFALAAFATSQRLEVVPSPEGHLLQVVTEFADEEAEGRETVQVQFSDNQFSLVGYYIRVSSYDIGGGQSTSECDVDFITGKITENGRERALPTPSEEDLNASGWSVGAAYDRNWCQR